MKKYRIELSQQAKDDSDDLYYFIIAEYKSIVTAKKYSAELRKTIRSLSKTAESFQIQYSPFFQQYGANARRINYKRMTAIYTVHADLVYVHRIIPSSMITDL